MARPLRKAYRPRDLERLQEAGKSSPEQCVDRRRRQSVDEHGQIESSAITWSQHLRRILIPRGALGSGTHGGEIAGKHTTRRVEQTLEVADDRSPRGDAGGGNALQKRTQERLRVERLGCGAEDDPGAVWLQAAGGRRRGVAATSASAPAPGFSSRSSFTAPPPRPPRRRARRARPRILPGPRRARYPRRRRAHPAPARRRRQRPPGPPRRPPRPLS